MQKAQQPGWAVLENHWELQQIKTFTGWVNTHLQKVGTAVEDIAVEFEDGVKFCQLIEALADVKLTYEKKPKMKFHKIINLNAGLAQLKDMGIRLTIQAEDIMEHNMKLILGLIWMLILKIQVAGISVEEKSSKEALLLWCQRMTANYAPKVNITNFDMSWQNGLAFCALLHKIDRKNMDFDSLDPEDMKGNLDLAFNLANDKYGIPKLLDSGDMTEGKPDQLSVITYVSQFFHVFAKGREEEKAGRRVGHLVDIMKTLDQLIGAYVEGFEALSAWIIQKTEELGAIPDKNTLTVDSIGELITALEEYRRTEKKEKNKEKLTLEAQFNAIQVKLRSEKRDLYVPKEGKTLADIDALWKVLVDNEKKRDVLLRTQMKRKVEVEEYVRRFEKKVEALGSWIVQTNDGLDKDLGDTVAAVGLNIALQDTLQDQFETMQLRLDSVEAISVKLAELEYSKTEDVQSTLQFLKSGFADLKVAATKRGADLEVRNKEVSGTEALRKEFYQKAMETGNWIVIAGDNLRMAIFPETVEEMEALLASKKEEAVYNEAQGKINAVKELGDFNIRGMSAQVLETKMEGLLAAIDKYIQAANAHMEITKERNALRAQWADITGKFTAAIDEGDKYLANPAGDDPQDVIAKYNTWLSELDAKLTADIAVLKDVEKTLTEKLILPEPSILVLGNKMNVLLSKARITLERLDSELESARREAAEKKAWEEQEKIEQKCIEFTKAAQKVWASVDMMMDFAQERGTFETIELATAALVEVHDKLSEAAYLEPSIPVTDVLPEQLARFTQHTGESLRKLYEQMLRTMGEKEKATGAEIAKLENEDARVYDFTCAFDTLHAFVEDAKKRANDISDEEELEPQLTKWESISSELAVELPKLDNVIELSSGLNVAAVIEKRNMLEAKCEQILGIADEGKALIEKKIMSIKMGDITPEQVEEWREVFQHFDLDNSNHLQDYEFKATLKGLGEDVADDEAQAIWAQFATDDLGIPFDKFCAYMRGREEDTDSLEEVLAAFKQLSGGEDYMSLEKLQGSGLEEDQVEYLMNNMPKAEDGSFDYTVWVKSCY